MKRIGWSVGGLLTAALSLIVLEVVFTSSANSKSGASQLGSLLEIPGRLASSWLDPSTPLIPDRSPGAPPPASSGSSTPTTTNFAAGQVAGANPVIVQVAGRGK